MKANNIEGVPFDSTIAVTFLLSTSSIAVIAVSCCTKNCSIPFRKVFGGVDFSFGVFMDSFLSSLGVGSSLKMLSILFDFSLAS